MTSPKFYSIKSFILGLDHLYKIRRDQLSFFQGIQREGKSIRLRIGPYRYWVLFDPAHIESVLKTNATSTIRFKRVINILAKWNGTSLLISEGEQWRLQRRAILPALKTAQIELHCRKIAELTQRWVNKRVTHSGGSFSLNIDEEMAQLTLIIAAQTMFDYDLSDRASLVVKAVSVLSDAAFNEAASLIPIPDWFPNKTKRDKSAAIVTMRAIVDDIIADKFSLPVEQQSEMVRLLNEQYGNNKRGIHYEIMTLLIAGHETTGAAISWIFFLLAKNPDVLAILQQELTIWPDDLDFIYLQLRQHAYLDAVVKEVMRLYPPAYTLFVRQATADFVMQDTQIKRGDLLHILPYVLHRNAEWFADPEVFRPARFLTKTTSWPQYSYLPFGGGARICLGQTFGMVELLIMTAVILRGMTPQAVMGDVIPEAKSSLRPKGGLMMAWCSR